MQLFSKTMIIIINLLNDIPCNRQYTQVVKVFTNLNLAIMFWQLHTHSQSHTAHPAILQMLLG